MPNSAYDLTKYELRKEIDAHLAHACGNVKDFATRTNLQYLEMVLRSMNDGIAPPSGLTEGTSVRLKNGIPMSFSVNGGFPRKIAQGQVLRIVRVHYELACAWTIEFHEFPCDRFDADHFERMTQREARDSILEL